MKFERYETRVQAGKILVDLIKEEDSRLYNQILKDSENFFCFAIPNGGVPIAEGFCSNLNIFYDILIVRKIKIPWNTEAGFGSVTTDGTILINHILLKQLSLSKPEIENSIIITKNEIIERLRLYNKESNSSEIFEKIITAKQVFLLDDGLASGFTMFAGIKMIKKYNPDKIYICIPTAPLHTIEKIKREVDFIFCPNIRNVLRFAVADAYKNWYDVPDTEIMNILKKSKYFLKKEK